MPTKTLSIVLADLIGSTHHATSVDAVRGATFLEDATKPIRHAITTNNGNLIKFTGDGFIATFECARDALICADNIRDHYLRQQYTPGGIIIEGVRVVVHTADVVFEDNDIVGDAIIVASRLEKSVPNNQVWVTAATREVVGISDFIFQPAGDIQLRGRPLPVTVYSLENTEFSFIESGTILMITDLHHFTAVTEHLAPLVLNNYLSKWVNLHRQAIKGLHGHIRQVISDMVLMTFNNADDALRAALNLKKLCEEQNEFRGEMPRYLFKSAIATGDIILTGSGIVGKLVNDTFELLNASPRETICVDPHTVNHLEALQSNAEGITLKMRDKDFACYKVVEASSKSAT
jgi:class 3 adenylate cyclase